VPISAADQRLDNKDQYMKKARFINAISAVALAFCVSAQKWSPDVLGGGFEMRYVEQPSDYAGAERCTVVRLRSEHNEDKAVLYIHGFNDYFFQAEMAREFVMHGYNFYAVDLRRYGRSLRDGDKPFNVRNLKEYFPDVDSALNIVRHDKNYEIILMGHSTGGLIAAYYLSLNPAAPVDALILNSPFLDWNLGWKECFVPVIGALGALFPDMPVPQDDSDVYSQSLLKSRHGEWSYDTLWKKTVSPDVNAGWVRAIDKAQNYLRTHKYGIGIPILLMYSDKSAAPEKWEDVASSSDVVLDVNDIRKYGMMLGHDIQPVVVKGGVHDLMLSATGVRAGLYRYVFDWLKGVK